MGPLAVNTVLPSADTTMPHGRSPTSTEANGVFVAVSMTTTFLPRPVVTKDVLAVGRRHDAHRAHELSGQLDGFDHLVFHRVDDGNRSAVLRRELSGRKAVDLGRGPTLIVFRTSSAVTSMTAT